MNGESGRDAHAYKAGEIALPGDIHAAKDTNDTGARNGTAGGQEGAPGENGGHQPGRPKRPDELSKEEQAQVQELRRIDMKVRAHEMAHLGASGGFATSGAKFEYKVGPDGKSYAVAGEVSIDTSPVRDNPQATIAKARTIRGAALAPADPSGADRAVAAAAAQMEAEAAQQLAREEQAENDPAAREPGEKNQTADAQKPNETGQAKTAYGIGEPERPGKVFDVTG